MMEKRMRKLFFHPTSRSLQSDITPVTAAYLKSLNGSIIHRLLE